MATLDKYGYRAYLKEKGLADDQITYDPDKNAVMAGGKFFANATPEADGSTYNSRANLDTLYKAYRGNDLYEKYANQATQKPPEIKVNPYKPLDMQTLQSNPAYQTGMQAAQQGAAIQQGNTLAKLRAGGQGKSSYSEGVANTIGQQAVTNFNAQYIPSAMTQHYNQYLKDTELAQGAEAENYNRNNTYAGNLKSVAGDYLGMYNNDLARQDKDKADRIKYAEGLRKDFGVPVDVKNEYGLMDEQVQGQISLDAQKQMTDTQKEAIKSELDIADKIGVVTPQLEALTGIPRGTPTWKAREFLMTNEVSRYNADTSRMNAQTSASNAQTSASRGGIADLYKQWEATGQAPAGIPGVAPGTPLYDKTGARQEAQTQQKQDQLNGDSFKEERDGMIGTIRNGELTLEDAMRQVNEDEDLGVYAPELAEQLRGVLRVLAKDKKIKGDKADEPKPLPSGITLDTSSLYLPKNQSVSQSVFGR